VAKKATNEERPTQDYRILNEWTIRDRYPLPLISELIDKLSKAKWFSKMDVRWGYNNIRIKEGDEWKAAFVTPLGEFEPTVMFFGMCNSPSTFQKMMNTIFHELIQSGVVVIYLDDILVFTDTKMEHHKIVREVLEILRKNNLYLQPKKCAFETQEIEYLGLIIKPGKIAMDPAKLNGIKDWPVPKNVKEIQRFRGFANFYRRFIQDFSKICKPLDLLTRKDQKWEWGPEQQKAFEGLKEIFTTAPILLNPDGSQPFTIEADASDFAMGAILSQYGEDNKLHPCAYFSKSMNSAERNYEIYDKEMLAIVRALEEWRHYVEGQGHKITIWSDHQNLQYFKTAQTLTRRQARWSLFLAQFDFEIAHRPGSLSGKPDALSR